MSGFGIVEPILMGELYGTIETTHHITDLKIIKLYNLSLLAYTFSHYLRNFNSTDGKRKP